MKIKDWCSDERPREKMLRKGASALGNAELLAIILRTGTQGANVMEVAHTLLSSVGGSLTKASRLSIEELCKIDGIGPGKAVSIVAALELGKRLCAEAPESDSKTITNSADVYREMIPEMKGLQHEECWVFFLSRTYKILSKERHSTGNNHETFVDVKTVVHRALTTGAVSIIIAHNHPSGDPHPGDADITMTNNLRKALKTFEIDLVDHVIFADGRYYSFTADAVIDADILARAKAKKAAQRGKR